MEKKKNSVDKPINKQDSKTYYDMAVAYNKEGKYDFAIDHYKKALVIQPTNIVYLQELGNIYENSKHINEAIECYEKIVYLQPINGVILNQLGLCYHLLSNNKKAIEYFKRIITIKNDIPEVYNNIGLCYISLRDYKYAESCLLISLRIRNDNVINSMLADLYFYIKKYDKSISFYKQIKNMNETQKYLYNMSFPYLAQSDFKTGLPLYESRLNQNNICSQTGQKQRVDIPWLSCWNGKNICNHLLVLYEQGIGDNIQYYRFIIQLSKLYPNMTITYFCKNIICHLFEKYPNINVVENLTDSIFDYKIYIMSLPYILNVETILPNTENYIHVDNEKLIYWADKLALFKKYKVGFVYNGLLSSFIEKNISLSEFESLCELDIDLICIHRLNEIQKDIDNNKSIINKIHFFDIDNNQNRAFEDTIAILKNIDLLITIDTSIAHLAGVLNVKTWLLLGYGSDWRWSNNENTTYWYNSVELIRMNENKELNLILKTVKSKLMSLGC